MATTVGEVNVKLAFDTKQLSTDQDKITKEVEGNWKNAGSKLENIAKTSAKVMSATFTAVGAAVVLIGKQAVESYAD